MSRLSSNSSMFKNDIVLIINQYPTFSKFDWYEKYVT